MKPLVAHSTLKVVLDFRLIQEAVSLKHGGYDRWRDTVRHFRLIQEAVSLKRGWCLSPEPLALGISASFKRRSH